MEIKQLLNEKEVKPFLKRARFGVEREAQRVTKTGALSQKTHPQALGSRTIHPTIQTDFAETQMELITPVFNTTKECSQYLEALHSVATLSLEDEYLWSCSMPPTLPESEEDIQIANVTQVEFEYRTHLASIYGKRKQMLSGVHFNFEFGNELLEKMFEKSDVHSFHAFKEVVYLKFARQYQTYQWFITYLFGASPMSYGNVDPEMDTLSSPVRSLRNSKFGYKNKTHLDIRYTTLQDYLNDLDDYVQKGILSEEKEYYAPIRLRGSGSVKELAHTGIHYVEIRNLDLNPFSPTGISLKQMDFLHFFALFLIWFEEKETDFVLAEEKNHQVAMENPFTQTAFLAEGKYLLQQMFVFAGEMDLLEEVESLLNKAETAFQDPAETICAQFLASHKTPLEWTKENNEQYLQRYFQLKGFEHLELSTQILMFDALQMGIKVKVLDPIDNLIALSFGEHTEIVKNGNITKHDALIHHYLLDNKIVIKKCLHDANFSVPLGESFSQIIDAKRAFDCFTNQAIVVKPKSTNYGIGITIFQNSPTREQFEKAVEFAFSHDKEIIIEEFIEGKEYRFFVVNGEVISVLSRIPTNVCGDGVHSIRELVEMKNQNTLRGEKHLYPLTSISLGVEEETQLSLQNMTFDSIPQKDERIFLRENSNISTGGDSIEVTPLVDKSYLTLASKIAQFLEVKIAGIDIILKDKTTPLTQENYSVIEVNYNPMMSMHVYPFEAKGEVVRVTKEVLQFLFPES